MSLPLVGYADRLVAAPGDRIRFMVSSERPEFSARLVRLGAGPARPLGQGYGEHAVPGARRRGIPGRVQALRPGSYVEVEAPPALGGDVPFTACTWLWTAIPGHGEQALLGLGDAPDAGFALLIGADGDLELRLGQGDGRVQHVHTGVPLQERMWTFAACAVDPGAGTATLVQYRHEHWPFVPGDASIVQPLLVPIAEPAGPLLLGACGSPAGAHLNGKLEAPMLLAGAAGPDQMTALAAGVPPGELGLALLAAWDFSLEPSVAPRRRRRGPTAATAAASTCRCAPSPGAAARGADDGLPRGARASTRRSLPRRRPRATPAGSPTSSSTVPGDLPSGVYAAPPRGRRGRATTSRSSSARRAAARARRWRCSCPTLSYLAYANEHGSLAEPDPGARRASTEHARARPARRPLRRRPPAALDSTSATPTAAAWPTPRACGRSSTCGRGYDMPLLARRRTSSAPTSSSSTGSTHGASTSTSITDEDLHDEGARAARAATASSLTGSHPEYWTTPMLDALEGCLDGGGRLMYLGGNGFYWVTSLHPEQPARARGPPRARRHARLGSEPGEVHHASTGELGGLWRTAAGRRSSSPASASRRRASTRSLPYRRAAAAPRPARRRSIFEGIARRGRVRRLTGSVLGGAAGFELDRADAELGTPPHALILATATRLQRRLPGRRRGHPRRPTRSRAARVSPSVRSDIVFFETADRRRRLLGRLDRLLRRAQRRRRRQPRLAPDRERAAPLRRSRAVRRAGDGVTGGVVAS